MKKALLFTVAILLTAASLSAQTIWNFGGDATVASNGSAAWAISSGLAAAASSTTNGGTETINGLTINTGMTTSTTLCGIVTANAVARTFTSPTTISYSFPNKFLLNGSGYAGSANTDATPLVNMPTQRYASFQVSGNSTIYMIGVTGSSASSRNLFVTNGTSYIGSVAFPGLATGTPSLNEGTITYTGPATTLYLFGNSSVALFYLSATNVVTTGVSQVLSDKGVSFNGTEIVNTKGLSIEVYSVLGKRVAGSVTSIPTANFQKGIYIVRISGSNESLKICI